MDIDGLPIVGASIDLTKVPSIHSKRTLAFLNHFICQTSNFLNKFACVCETKLEDINTRIQRIETALSILEAKLSSVPGLDDIQVQKPKASPETNISISEKNGFAPEPSPVPNSAGHIKNDTSIAASPSPSTDVEGQRTEVVVDSESTNNLSSGLTVSQDPRYIKYFKLLKIGVPLLNFRSKMVADGLDPDLLEKPNAPAPPYDPDKEVSEHTDSDSEPGSDFSD